MRKLLKIEWQKIKTYKTFWLVISLYFVFLLSGIMLAELIFNAMIDDLSKNSPFPLPHVSFYTFPDIWHNITYFASIRFVVIFPAVLVIILVCNEFSFKTSRQNILNGLSRTDFVTSKLILVTVLSFFILLVIMISSLILGIIHTDEITVQSFFHKFEFLGGFFIQMLTLLVFSLFIAFMIRSTALSIAVFTFYVIIMEPILVMILKIPNFQPNTVGRYFPINNALNIVEYPSVTGLIKTLGFRLQENVVFQDIFLSIGYTLLFCFLIYFSMRKRDI
ncbi:MAG: hypothetical protein FJY10_03200 [Bacteroidetes bacterium]|nr:hypothetical protein [Bacteroidota bacterium]